MQFNIAIGDWSDDGHGECRNFLCEADAPIEWLREAYFKLEGILGFKLSDVCGKYREVYMKLEHAERLYELRLISRSQYYNIKSDNPDPISPEEMADIVIAALNMIDGDFKIRHSKPQNRIPDLHFYGFDEHGRHIDFIGYGVFGNV